MTLSLAKHLPHRHRRVLAGCLCATVALLALHGLYWLPARELPLQSLAGFLLNAGYYLAGVTFFLALFLLLAVWTPLLLLAPFSARVRLAIGERRATGAGGHRLVIRPWLHSVGWLAILLGHLGLDLDPPVALAGWSGLVLLLPEVRRIPGRILGSVSAGLARPASWLVGAGLLGALWWPAASDPARTRVLLAMAALLLLAHFALSRWLVLRDRFLLCVFGLAALQGVGAFLPLFSTPPHATPLGAGRASDFAVCGERLFVAVPRCSAQPGEIEACRERSTIDEFAPGEAGFSRTTRHRFYSEDFAGRVARLGCFAGRVQAGLDLAMQGDRLLSQSLLEFDARDPARFRTGVLGDASGQGFAFDPGRGVAWYRSDAVAVVRRDLSSEALDRSLGARAGIDWVADLGFHAGRDALLALPSYGRLLELGAGDGARRAGHPFLQAWELTVDEALGRAYLVGGFGLEVLDLEAGRVVARRRIGLTGRRPALDACHHVLYVPSTTAARLQAFDRLSLEPLGSLPLGPGMGLPHVTPDGRHLLAGTAMAYYVWDAAELARALRHGAPPPAPPDAGCAPGTLPLAAVAPRLPPAAG